MWTRPKKQWDNGTETKKNGHINRKKGIGIDIDIYTW